MGVLSDIRAAWSAPSVSDDGNWTTMGGGAVYASMSGVTITEDIALTDPVVFDCAWILMDSVGQAPTILYDRSDDGGRERSTSRLGYRLREQPNSDQTAIEFKREMQQSACFYANAYAEITWVGADPVEVVPRHPNRIRIEKTGAGKRYGYLEDDATWRPILPSNMLRVPGRPVLKYASETIAHSIALERYSRNLFGKGFRPGVAAEWEKGYDPDDLAKERVKSQMVANNSGANAGGVFMAPPGLHVNPWGMTNQEAEFKDVRGALTAAITRFWRIPPYVVGLLESGTVSYASVNTQAIDFVVYTLMPWFVGWEQAYQRDLVVDKQGQFVEFLAASLLRGTTAERYNVYAIALDKGIMSVNEVRRLENLNPVPGGDIRQVAQDVQPFAAHHVEAGSPADKLLQALTHDTASRVLRRETGALAKLAERAGPDAKAWEAGVKEFYSAHPAFVAEALHLPLGVATAYATGQQYAVLADGPSVAARWNGDVTARLARLALTEGAREVAA